MSSNQMGRQLSAYLFLKIRKSFLSRIVITRLIDPNRPPLSRCCHEVHKPRRIESRPYQINDAYLPWPHLTVHTLTTAFCPVVEHKTQTTALTAIDRRRVLITAAGVVLAPLVTDATPQAVSQRAGVHTHANTWVFDENIENVCEEAQMPTGEKVDLNSAIVISGKSRNNMYLRCSCLLLNFALLYLCFLVDGISAVPWCVPSCGGHDCLQWTVQFRQGHLQDPRSYRSRQEALQAV